MLPLFLLFNTAKVMGSIGPQPPKNKPRKGRPWKCKLSLHDKSTKKFILSISGTYIERNVCKNCREFILPLDFLEQEKFRSQQEVKILETELVFYEVVFSPTLTSSTTSNPYERRFPGIDNSKLIKVIPGTIREGSTKVNPAQFILPEAEKKYNSFYYKIRSVKREVGGDIFNLGDKVKIKGSQDQWIIADFFCGDTSEDPINQKRYCVVSFQHTSTFTLSIGLIEKIY